MWDDFVFEEDLGMVLLMLKYILLLYPKIGTPKVLREVWKNKKHVLFFR